MKFIQLLLIVLSLSGCVASLRNIDGKIEKGKYTGKNNEFSVAMPWVSTSYEYKYFDFKERYTDDGSEVIFGPGAYDKSIYRVTIFKNAQLQEVSFDVATNKILSAIVPIAEGEGGTPLREETRGFVSLGNKDVKCVRYVQAITSNRAIPLIAEGNWTQHAYFFKGKTSIAMLWVQVPGKCPVCQSGAESGLKTRYLNVDRFVRSFEFN